MSRKTTIRDVARLANTSVSTVSAAFSGNASIATETRERVIEAANRLGWRADRRASQLRRNNFAAIGVMYDVGHAFQSSLLDPLYEVSAARGFELALAGVTSHHSEVDCLHELLGERCGALLLASGGLKTSLIAEAAKIMPVVILCSTTDLPRVDQVASDAVQGEGLIVQHLVDFGHRRIWYADAPGRPMATERAQGFLDASEGVVSVVALPAGDTVEAGIATADALLDSDEPPTAVVTYNDEAGAALVRRLRQRGVRVPADVSVVGYDDSAVAADPTISLTTVRQPTDQVAERAFDLLGVRLGEGVCEPGGEQRLFLPAQLVVRESTGPARERRISETF